LKAVPFAPGTRPRGRNRVLERCARRFRPAHPGRSTPGQGAFRGSREGLKAVPFAPGTRPRGRNRVLERCARRFRPAHPGRSTPCQGAFRGSREGLKAVPKGPLRLSRRPRRTLSWSGGGAVARCRDATRSELSPVPEPDRWVSRPSCRAQEADRRGNEPGPSSTSSSPTPIWPPGTGRSNGSDDVA
jgi:hypothetical protein